MTPTHTIVAVPALAVAMLLPMSSPAHSEPLLCVDIGAIDIGPYSVDPPEICVL